MFYRLRVDLFIFLFSSSFLSLSEGLKLYLNANEEKLCVSTGPTDGEELNTLRARARTHGGEDIAQSKLLQRGWERNDSGALRIFRVSYIYIQAALLVFD